MSPTSLARHPYTRFVPLFLSISLTSAQACKRGHFSVVNLLLSNQASHSTLDANGRAPLHHAVYSGSVETVHFLLETPGMQTCEPDHHLMTPGVDVNVADNAGFTPQHMAARYGHIEGLIQLLNAGADASKSGGIHRWRCTDLYNRKAADGSSALHLAAQYGHSDCVRCSLMCASSSH